MDGGIYCIIHTASARRYVGRAVNLSRRWMVHRANLRSGGHVNPALQSAWNKYGEGSFEFVVLERCAPEFLTPREQYWLDHFQSYEKGVGFNIAKCATAPTHGLTFSDATRAKMRSASLGRPKTETHAKAISEGRKGKTFGPLSDAHRRAIGAASRGKRISDEQRELLRRRAEERWSDPVEAERLRKAVSAARAGRTNSPEHRANLSAANKAAWADPQKRAAIMAKRAATKARKSCSSP